jgi:hypothetical protein
VARLRTTAVVIALCASMPTSSGAQGALAPIALRGFVHREAFFGSGEGWEASVASSDVTLDVSRNGRARLHVEAHVVDAHGGASLLDRSQRFHDEVERPLAIDWTGRARRAHGVLVIALHAATVTDHPTGTAAGTSITTRMIVDAELACALEEHDLLAPSRPAGSGTEPVASHRAVHACRFAPTEHEGPLPRPVRDALTVPFFLDAGAGVTTDARYEGVAVTDPAASLVVREPGWVEPEGRL